MLLTEESKTTSNLSTVHTALDEFENEAFTLNTNKLFSVRPMLDEFKNTTITGQFAFVFEENRVIIVTSSSFSKCFTSTRKQKVGIFQFFRFEEGFLKVPLS